MLIQKIKSHASTLAIFCLSVSLTLAMYYKLEQVELERVQLVTEHALNVSIHNLEKDFHRQQESLQTMAFRWKSQQGTPYQQWYNDAHAYLAGFSSVSQILWLDGDGSVQWHIPQVINKEIRQLITQKSELSPYLEEGKKRNAIVTPPPIHGEKSSYFFFLLPIYLGDYFDGFFITVYDTQTMFAPAIGSKVLQRFDFEVSMGVQIFESTLTNKKVDALSQLFHIANTEWQLILSPNQTTMAQTRSPLPLVVLMIGILASSALTLLIRTHNKNKILSQYLFNVIDSTKTIFITLDEKNQVVSANQAAIDFLGYTESEMKKLKLKHILKHQNAFNLHHSIGIDTEALFIDKQGNEKPLLINLSKIKDQAARTLNLISAKDISERKAFEKALAKSEAKYRAIVEDQNELICQFDQGFKLDFVNQAYANFFAISEELISPTLFLNNAHQRSQIDLPQSEKDPSTHQEQLLVIAKENYWLSWSFRVLDCQEEGRKTFQAVGRDITQTKRAEAVREELTEKLLHSNQALEDFAYIASHDLKEPLRGINNYVAQLSDAYSDKLNDEYATFVLGRLKALTFKMESLISSLLKFSRLGQEISLTALDTEALVKDVKQTLHHLVLEEQVLIKVLSPLPNVIGDKTMLHELLMNLITNGVKYNKSPDKLIEIGFDQHYQALYVRDNGIGIAEHFHEKVFKIFKRLHGEGEYGGGSGAGLTIVKKIVEQHKGKVWITSKEGYGTCVFIQLTLVEETIPEVEEIGA